MRSGSEIAVAKSHEPCAYQNNLAANSVLSVGVTHHFQTSKPMSVKFVGRRTCFISQTLNVQRNCVTNCCVVVLYGSSLPGYALIKEQQKTIWMRINVWNEHKFCWRMYHLHSFSVTGVNSGLEVRVTVTRILRGRLGRV